MVTRCVRGWRKCKRQAGPRACCSSPAALHDANGRGCGAARVRATLRGAALGASGAARSLAPTARWRVICLARRAHLCCRWPRGSWSGRRRKRLSEKRRSAPLRGAARKMTRRAHGRRTAQRSAQRSLRGRGPHRRGPRAARRAPEAARPRRRREGPQARGGRLERMMMLKARTSQRHLPRPRLRAHVDGRLVGALRGSLAGICERFAPYGGGRGGADAPKRRFRQNSTSRPPGGR